MQILQHGWHCLPDARLEHSAGCMTHMPVSTDELTWHQRQLPEDKLLRGVYAVLLPFCREEVSQLAHVLFAEFTAQGLPP